MNNMQQQLSNFQNLPSQLQKLVKKPTFQKIPFSSLTENNVQKAVQSIKTNTLLKLFNPPEIQQENVGKDKIVILVFCQPSEQVRIDKNTTVDPYVPVSYCKWLESAGAKCVPLPYNLNEGSIQFLIQRSNGLLIPGGNSNLYKNYAEKQGQGPIMLGFFKIWRYILKMWNKGVHYPIWGTCLGLEMVLMAITNDTKVLSHLNSRGHQVQIYPQYENSKIFKQIPLNLRIHLQHKKLINFAHMHGISVKKYRNNLKLQQKLKISAVSRDKDGRWFCSALEGKSFPIFLSQFHPQKQGFQFNKSGDIVNNKFSIQISQQLAQAFMKQCHKTKPQHSFISESQEQFYMFQQYRQIYPEKLYKVYAVDFRFREYDKEQRKKLKSQKKVVNQPSNKKIFI